MQITRRKSTTWRTFKCLQNGKSESRILKQRFSALLFAYSKDTNSTDFDTYNECICFYGPEFGSYCFSLNSDVGLVEINAAENI